MRYNRDASKTFRDMAQRSEPASKDEALFSGLAKLASDLEDVKRKVTKIERLVKQGLS